jgi:hypothetical protein
VGAPAPGFGNDDAGPHPLSARHLAGLPRAQPAPRAIRHAAFACSSIVVIQRSGSSTQAPAVEPAQLAGLWVTGYVFDGTKRHVDLSAITVTNNAVTARNYPPEPRAEAHASGFRNEIEAGLFGRHLIGRWRNINDSYTGFLSDSQVVAEQWRWVRVEPQSAEGVDVNTVVLGEPRRIYDAIVGRSPFDAPIPLEQLTENP